MTPGGARGPVDAVVLAGGQGTRLRAAVPDHPKPLAPVGGAPFLDLLLAWLSRSGAVARVVLAVGHQAERFVERYQDSRAFGFPVACSVETTPLGTGGGLKLALARTTTPTVLVVNGDTFLDLDPAALVAAHARRAARLTMAVVHVPDAGRFGAVEFDAATMTVTAFREKDDSRGAGYVNGGWYVLDRRVGEAIPAGAAVSLERDVIPALLPGVAAHVAAGRFLDIGTPESYGAAERLLGDLPPGAGGPA